MDQPDYKALTTDELIDLFRDKTQPAEVRDAAYEEAEKRRVATFNKRHSADDEPETL